MIIKNFIKVLCTLFSLTLFSNGIGAAELHSDYFSIHDEDQIIEFHRLNNEGSIVNANEPRRGFENIYNLNDPIIECHSENPCYSNEEYVDLPTKEFGQAGVNNPLTYNGKFRLFVPPGTIKIGVTMYCQAQSGVLAAVRFKNPPECVNCESTFSTSYVRDENTYPFQELSDTDIYLSNNGGHITVYSRYIYPFDGTQAPAQVTEDQAGWLYVNVYEGARSVGQIQYTVQVHKQTYLNWYNSYFPITDLDYFSLALYADTNPGDPGNPDPGDPGNPPPDASVSPADCGTDTIRLNSLLVDNNLYNVVLNYNAANNYWELTSAEQVTVEPTEPDPVNTGLSASLEVGTTVVSGVMSTEYRATFSPTIRVDGVVQQLSDYTFHLDYGDGDSESLSFDSYSQRSHTYDSTGPYTAVLAATNSDGTVATATYEVTFNNN